MDLTCDTKSHHIVLFQKNKGVKIIAVGVGDPKKFKQSEFMHEIVGKKGKLILKEDFDELLKEIGEVLDEACGECNNLQAVLIVEPRKLASLYV